MSECQSDDSIVNSVWFQYGRKIVDNGNPAGYTAIMYTGSNGGDLYTISNATKGSNQKDGIQKCYIDSATDYIDLYVGDIVYYDDRLKLKRLTSFVNDVKAQQKILHDLSQYNKFCREFVHKNVIVRLIDKCGIELSEHQQVDYLRKCVRLMFNDHPISEQDWFHTIVAVTNNDNR